jgi:hypothetical protein
MAANYSHSSVRLHETIMRIAMTRFPIEIALTYPQSTWRVCVFVSVNLRTHLVLVFAVLPSEILQGDLHIPDERARVLLVSLYSSLRCLARCIKPVSHCSSSNVNNDNSSNTPLVDISRRLDRTLPPDTLPTSVQRLGTYAALFSSVRRVPAIYSLKRWDTVSTKHKPKTVY